SFSIGKFLNSLYYFTVNRLICKISTVFFGVFLSLFSLGDVYAAALPAGEFEKEWREITARDEKALAELRGIDPEGAAFMLNNLIELKLLRFILEREGKTPDSHELPVLCDRAHQDSPKLKFSCSRLRELPYLYSALRFPGPDRDALKKLNMAELLTTL